MSRPNEGDRLAQFERTPWDVKLFEELQASLRKGGENGQIARLYELRGPHETDRAAAADLWCRAGEARLAGGDIERADENLRKALALDQGNVRAASLVATRLQGAGRFAEAADVLEAELEALAANPAVLPHRATRHRELARLWEQRLGRVDRALHHWRRAWELERQLPQPPHGDAAATGVSDALRALHASLGDEAAVIELYREELEWLGETGPGERRARLAHQLGVLHARRGEAEAAARHLERALALAPDDAKKELLAEVYAQRAEPRAVELYLQLAASRRARKDMEGAVTFLRRALGVDPRSEATFAQLEQALAELDRWREIERLYLGRARGPRPAADTTQALLLRRAAILVDKVKDRDGAKRAFEELGAAGAGRLRELYRADGDWAKLADLMERGLDALPPEAQAGELLELATIAREHLSDRDRAADCLHKILVIDPRHPEALARYAEHFREKRDWRGLADLADFAVEAAKAAGAPQAEVVRRLEELAQTSELRLGDVERATQAWRRVAQLEPDNAKAREAIRRLESRAKMWESLIAVLEKEAAAAVTPKDRAEALKRIAQVYRERQVDPRRAIALYVEALAIAPEDPVALKALADLYEREGDDAGLARTLRTQLELGGSVDRLPQAQRIERLTALRRLAAMYESRLGDVEGVVYACTATLEILPGDRDAMERLERVLQRSGDVARLEQTLTYRAEALSGPADRGKALRKLAKLGEARKDSLAAMERWEAVLKAAPNDPEALTALARLYEEARRWTELALVLERLILTARPEAKAAADPVARTGELKRFARVLDDKIDDGARAVKAWQRVLEAVPRDREALEALAARYEAQGNWRDLAEVLGRQVALHLVDDRPRAAEIGLRRARLLEERLGAPKDAVQALEALLGEVDPGNLEAHRQLRRLYEARGDFELAVRTAERELWLARDVDVKTDRGLEIGLLCRDRLADPRRALQAFERVLLLAPALPEALAAAAELYARVGEWRKHVAALEQLAVHAAPAEQQTMYAKIARAVEDKIKDPRAAFRWWHKAHRIAPSAATLDEIRRAAERHELPASLAEVYEEERQAARAGGDLKRYVALCRDLAAVTERRLGDPPRTLEILRDAVAVAPEDDALIVEVERVAADHGAQASWQAALTILGMALDARRDPAERVAMHERRARVLDERLGDPSGALDELLRAFALRPGAAARDAILPLAERTGRWEDALSVETALFAREPTPAGRIEAACRAAQLIEEKLDQPVRAFRGYLRAFRLLAPEAVEHETEVTGHLWRLARRIGNYREEDQVAPTELPVPPPPPPARPAASSAAVSARMAAATSSAAPTSGAAAASGAAATGAAATGGAAGAAGAAAPAVVVDAGGPPRPDSTIPLSLDDLMPASPRSDPTIELKPEDLIATVVPLAGTSTPSPAPSPSLAAMSPPPLPSFFGMVVPPPRKPASASTPPATPALPGIHARAVPRGKPVLKRFASAWEELAWAYEQVPAPDDPARVRNLFRAAEVWERGAENLPRAFDTLSRALALTPADPEPKERLYRLAGDHDAWDHLAGLFIAAAERAGKAEEVAKLLHEVAHIRARQGQPRDAEATYRRILGMRPDDDTARRELEVIFRAEERWVDLAASLEERADPRLASPSLEPERPALLRELAQIYDAKLAKPYEAIGALERLTALVPDDVDALEQVATVYTRVGRWAKVVEALARVAELAEGRPGAREARRRVARIYETELELPERATEAYEAIVAAWPDDADAWAALDRLLEQAARWQDLVEVLRRRAALTPEVGERAGLLRRRARVLLERLGRADEAVAGLRHARALAPADAELAEDMTQALIAAGGAREAAAVLEERVADVERQGGPPGDVAALLLRLATLRADSLDDRDGARKALERVLAVVPDHPSALAALAKLARGVDARAYADARLREAAGATDVAAKVAALLEAGEALRDRVGDEAGARDAFRRILELEPANAEATWALSAMVATGGDVPGAVALLERRLSEDLPAAERVRVLTELAALAQRAGVPAAAERRLEEALTVLPDHLPAVIARADLYQAEGAFEELAAFLREVLPRLEAAGDAGATALSGEVRAELDRRLADAYEKLGRDDEAYLVLLEADKLHRNDLLTKLALGENRYRARRWREAALHLAGLADHPDAPSRAAEVAEGLYHAALAEIRALRPDRAPGLYQAALRLKPDYSPALHALAEIEMERGDVARAAELLEKQAAATPDPAERLRLFEALGDLALVALSDPARARACFEQAVAAAAPLESKHVPLLRKLIVQQREASDMAGVGRTCELLSSFSADARARAHELLEAADAYLAAGEAGRARAVAARALEAEPFDEDALWTATRLELEAPTEPGRPDHEAIASRLGRALHVLPAPGEHQAPRRAELWRRLGDARRARGDVRGALAAYEKAVAAAPDSDAGIAARRIVIGLPGSGRLDVNLSHLRAVVATEQDPVEVLALGRALAVQTGAGPVDEDGARALLELAATLGQELGPDDKKYLYAHPARTMASDEVYAASLDDDDHAALFADEHDAPLREILAAMAEAAPLLLPEPARALEAAGVTAERVGPREQSAAISIFSQIAKTLGTPATVIHAARASDGPDVAVIAAAPPVLVLGRRMMAAAATSSEGVDPVSDAELRFLLGRAALLLRPARLLAAGLSEPRFGLLVAGLARAFGGTAAGAADLDATEVDAEADRLRRTLPFKVRMRAEPLVRGASLDAARYRAASERAADRAGLLLCANVTVALRCAGGPGRARHLVRMAATERYLQARAKIGVGASR
jgi:tetratricopeptide (TPR) repeat protein